MDTQPTPGQPAAGRAAPEESTGGLPANLTTALKIMNGAGGPLTASELAARMGKGRWIAHNALLRLEASGHVTRAPDAVPNGRGRGAARWALPTDPAVGGLLGGLEAALRVVEAGGGPVTTAQLAARLGVSYTTARAAIGRLEASGHLTRAPDAAPNGTGYGAARWALPTDSALGGLAEDLAAALHVIETAGGPVTATELATRLGVSHPTAYGALARLEASGHLTRAPDAAPGRGGPPAARWALPTDPAVGGLRDDLADVLRMVEAAGGPVTVGQVASRLGRAIQTARAALGRLEASGHLSRAPDAAPGRAGRVAARWALPTDPSIGGLRDDLADVLRVAKDADTPVTAGEVAGRLGRDVTTARAALRRLEATGHLTRAPRTAPPRRGPGSATRWTLPPDPTIDHRAADSAPPARDLATR
ncbi:MarR family transcriptional regulator [Frankia sp. AgB1.9]|uniref:MarR family transcriptional regulator n=1 Tax=Frankia sp. AgB1.9 TaxID=1836968 RepID=UPI001933D828|nr:helix-turn-helix domain-containing protein [Frankia sp. AgB1.9]MBL7551917.1 MarR family transcriptional regulator [Frankia sp. AgB1.9]